MPNIDWGPRRTWRTMRRRVGVGVVRSAEPQCSLHYRPVHTLPLPRTIPPRHLSTTILTIPPSKLPFIFVEILSSHLLLLPQTLWDSSTPHSNLLVNYNNPACQIIPLTPSQLQSTMPMTRFTHQRGSFLNNTGWHSSGISDS